MATPMESVREVVIVNTTRGRFPTAARIFEIADEFAFFAVHADDGQMTALEAVAQLGQIFELKIPVRAEAGRDLLLIDPQRIAHGMEQAGDGMGETAMPSLAGSSAIVVVVRRDQRKPVTGSPAVQVLRGSPAKC
jgi:hypothetical protein